MKVLLEHAGKIIQGIFDTVEDCPGELRTVLASLQQAVQKKWPKEPLVPYTAVSAFLFLRLFCPAIMNPKLFNMMPGWLFSFQIVFDRLFLPAFLFLTLPL